jgi:hypothetical protein
LIVRDHVVMVGTDLAYSFVLSAFPAGFVNVLLVVPCLLAGGLDLDSEGPRVDGELGLGVWRRLSGLHSLGLHVSLLVNVVLSGLIVGANLGDLVHDFKLGFFLLRSHFIECITK